MSEEIVKHTPKVMDQPFYRVVIHIEADEMQNPEGKYDYDPESVKRFSEFFDVRAENIQSIEWVEVYE